MSNETVFDPMKGVVAEANSGGLPVGTYVGLFQGAEYLPVIEADPMTGKGGRQWAKVAFKWGITTEGEFAGKVAIRETPCSIGAKASYTTFCGHVMGRTLTASEKIDLTPFVGKKYLLTVSNQVDANGNQKAWTHVSNAIPMPA